MRSLFVNIDVLATPATATTATTVPLDAARTGESNLELLDRIMRFATLANLTGLPAISFPAGYDRSGLPVNLQLMAPAWHEHVLLRAAFCAEQSCERRLPKVHYRLLDTPPSSSVASR
jgi:Asp-tRNA(Asn)/Glu-tRNA(Gln) amidotransferase A subunit family amidase